MMMASRLYFHSLQILCLAAVLYLVPVIIAAKEAAKEKVYYGELERFHVTHFDPAYFASFDFRTRRYSRRDPVHYLNIHAETLVPMGNEIRVDVYIYEFLSNEYRRSFVEMHYQMCDFVFKDKFFGPFVYPRIPAAIRTCPFPKAVYDTQNVSISNLPVLSTFPFQKGRIFFNMSHPAAKNRIVIASAYCDSLIKFRWK